MITGKTKINTQKLLSLVIGILLSILVGVLIGLNLAKGKIKNDIKDVGCEGIKKFENMTFQEAKENIENLYTKRTKEIRTPQELIEKGGDCKSVSKALMCLCKRRNRNCEYYVEIRKFNYPFFTGHIGVEEYG